MSWFAERKPHCRAGGAFGWMGLPLGVAIWRAPLADRELRKQEVVKVEKAVQRCNEMDAEAGGTMAGETQGEP